MRDALPEDEVSPPPAAKTAPGPAPAAAVGSSGPGSGSGAASGGCAKQQIDAKSKFMNDGEKYPCQVGEAMRCRSALALNPCVGWETNMVLYDQMTVFAEHVQRYLTSTQDNIRDLLETRGHHHTDLERQSPTGAASNNSQHDASDDIDAAHTRA